MMKPSLRHAAAPGALAASSPGAARASARAVPRPTARAAEREAPLWRRYAAVRAQTMALAAPLSEADCQVQSMPDASPTKWHLAHVTWFFETFVLERHESGFKPHHGAFRVLFNSYYHGVGQQHPRAQRGLVTRPGLSEVKAYRSAVDERMGALLEQLDSLAPPLRDEIATLVELGLQHEQQHQELILTDLKHLLGCSPLAPVYQAAWPLATVAAVPHGWVEAAGGLVQIGHPGAAAGFCFDNETPRHQVFLKPYALGNRLVTHGEWLEFMQAGGYAEPRWWLSAGWDWRQRERIEAPMYWRGHGSDWASFTLHGEVPLDPHTPVVHVSLYEADAYARWRGEQLALPVRLPTEAEWEAAASRGETQALAEGNFVDTAALHPMPLPRAPAAGEALQMLGDVWEWTNSSYHGYPGFRPWAGAVGEYNGKFMINQYVLRGGSCATPREHIRASYRNFFPAETRWQFSGVRLACDLS